MNVLLVGLGRWGEKHLRVLTQLGATVWVADVAPERRQWASGQGVDPARAVADFGAALLGSIVISIVGLVLSMIMWDTWAGGGFWSHRRPVAYDAPPPPAPAPRAPRGRTVVHEDVDEGPY
jgi:hypothetical protein